MSDLFDQIKCFLWKLVWQVLIILSLTCGSGLLLTVNDNLWQYCNWLFAWYLFDLLTWFEWSEKYFLCLRVYEIDWVWHSWLSLLSSWVRFILFNCEVFLDCDWGWLWCHWVECDWTEFVWAYVNSLGCSNVYIDEMGQVRRVG